MKIAVDAGALCSKSRFGNYTFAENLIKALEKFDKVNNCHLYTFCMDSRLRGNDRGERGNDKRERGNDKKVKIIKLPSKLFRFWGMFEDVVLALNQQPPLWTRGKIISFCHGLSFHFYPEYYSKEDVNRLEKQLYEMVNRSDIIIVSSEKVMTELVSMYRYIDTKIVDLPFGAPYDMTNNKTENCITFLRPLKSETIDKRKYFLFVGMDHPIKNIDFIKKAFEKFRSDKKYEDYKLYLITKNISRIKLRQLYQSATALLTASHYESFNFPVLEALANDCQVIGLRSAVIPEMQEFVNICDNNIEEFVLKMKNCCREKKEADQKKLRQIFNWEKYIGKLSDLY